MCPANSIDLLLLEYKLQCLFARAQCDALLFGSFVLHIGRSDCGRIDNDIYPLYGIWMVRNGDLGMKIGGQVIGDLSLLDITARYRVSFIGQKLCQCRKPDATNPYKVYPHHDSWFSLPVSACWSCCSSTFNSSCPCFT